MAISAPHYHCLKELHRRGELPQGGALLEIGEANWYGDMPLDDVSQEIHRSDRTDLRKPFHDCWEWQGNEQAWRGEWSSFEVVKVIYALYFQTTQVTSIDMHGPTALKLDLNKPISAIDAPAWLPDSKFTTVINHGTLEHIFNPAQVLRTMHDYCASGGLLIHESPFTGWIDHGFWTIQPTLYFDLAAANGYEMTFMAVTHIDHGSAVEIHSREQLLKMAAAGGVPNNSMLYVAMRKASDEPFKIPMQGVYAKNVSQQAVEAWRALR